MKQENKSQILLIDDDTSLLATLSDFLAFEGYAVSTADSGEEGLKRLETQSPDLIILDLSMPGMGGMAFLRTITTGTGQTRFPVLVLTARANMAEYFADVDVDGFVAKPCDPEDLLMEVSRIIFLRRGVAGTAGAVSSGKTKALVGDDHDPTRRRLAAELAGEGYVVDAVSGAADTVERAIVERPNVIVMRRSMAGLTGDAAAEMLGVMPHTQGIPVLLYDREQDARGASDEGGLRVSYLANDDISDLVGAVKNVLASTA